MSDVPRETPPAPETARGVFSSQALPAVERYAALLATLGVERGLIGPREVPRLWDRHLLNCAALAPAVPEGVSVADVGSGAGLPGVVLALARPDLAVTLVEPLLRRTVFLEEVVAELGLTTVTVVRGRAEALHGVERFDVVTSRAVAPLGRLLGWCMPLVAPSGEMLALKGSSVEDEIETVRPTLRALGYAEPEVLVVGSDEAARVRAVRVRWADPARVSWPIVPPAGRPSGVGRRTRNGRKGRR